MSKLVATVVEERKDFDEDLSQGLKAKPRRSNRQGDGQNQMLGKKTTQR